MLEAARLAYLREALEHALNCPLAQDCFRIMKDEPEKITACEGCKRMLLVLRIEALEGSAPHA